VEGDFVRVVQGKVVISVNGRAKQVPFGHLSPDDQDFVREQLEAKGLGDQVPAKKKPAAEAKDEKSDTTDNSQLSPERTWTDINGHKLQARLVGMEDGKIVLTYQGNLVRFPFDKFSRADRDYVRGQMLARGEGDKVPDDKVPDNKVPAEQAAPQMVQGAVPPLAPAVRPTAPGFPHRPLPPRAVASLPQLPEIHSPAPIPGVTAAPESPEVPTVPHPAVPALPVPAFPSFTFSSPHPDPTPVTPSVQPSFPIKVKVCLHCGQTVPDSLTAGDTCPHCGVYFSKDETTGAYKPAPLHFGVGIVVIIVGVIARLALRRR
jgi:hypothetical protein